MVSRRTSFRAQALVLYFTMKVKMADLPESFMDKFGYALSSIPTIYRYDACSEILDYFNKAFSPSGNKIVNDVECHTIHPPTTFIHAGYSPLIILFCMHSGCNIYTRESPNPYHRDFKGKPELTVEKNHMVVIEGYTQSSFTIEPLVNTNTEDDLVIVCLRNSI